MHTISLLFILVLCFFATATGNDDSKDLKPSTLMTEEIIPLDSKPLATREEHYAGDCYFSDPRCHWFAGPIPPHYHFDGCQSIKNIRAKIIRLCAQCSDHPEDCLPIDPGACHYNNDGTKIQGCLRLWS